MKIIKNLLMASLLTGLSMSGNLLASDEASNDYESAITECENRKAKRLFRGCMDGYKGSPVFRKRCQAISDSQLDAQKPVCKAMVDQMKATDIAEKTGH